MTRWPDYVAALGRLLMSVIFILGGIGKLADHGNTVGYIRHVGLPLPEVAYIVSVIAELGGGLLLLVGFQARCVGAVLAIFCIVTAVTFHNNLADQTQMINFLKNLAMTGGFLYVVAYGAGALSIDSRRRG